MNILMCHNYYQQPGGEDQSYQLEARLLADSGHTVTQYEMSNDRINHMSKAAVAVNTFWNPSSFQDISSLVRTKRVRVAHFQNTFPLISPSAYYAAQLNGAVCIQALRNYRLTCVNGLLFRDGHICEDCVGKTLPVSGIQHGCYRHNRPASAVVGGMTTLHKVLPTYSRVINAYIAVSEFVKQKYVESGFPAEKIYVKPNFVEDFTTAQEKQATGKFFLYVGRLSSEKGIRTLLEVFTKRLPGANLKIVGDGPLMEQLQILTSRTPNIELLGRKPLKEVYDLMAAAQAVIVPSEWHEPFGRVVVEAFAAGTPVIAAAVGGMTELIDHERTGFLFNGGEAESLWRACENFLTQENRWAELGKAARHEYETKYTGAVNYQRMMEIYESVTLT